MADKNTLTQVEQALDFLIGISDTFNKFDIYDDGKLVIGANKEDQIVMQFDDRNVAQAWLVEHFAQFKSSSHAHTVH